MPILKKYRGYLSVIIVNVFLSLFCYKAHSAVPTDSIGIEKKDGKIFILHKVESKETLYSISKKYSVSADLIKEANPELADGLKLGQTIRIPSKNVDSSSDNEETYTEQSKTHKVAAKETLYSVSKKYAVSIDELKKANPQIADGLKEGMVLVIPSVDSPKERTKIKVENQKEKKEESIKPAKADKEVGKSEKEEAPASQQSSTGNYSKISESGYLTLMENNNDSKYLALHKTAPVGTIIQVKNESNGQKIFVRVVGKLNSDDSKDKVILKVSPKAYERLGGEAGKKMSVSITYIP